MVKVFETSLYDGDFKLRGFSGSESCVLRGGEVLIARWKVYEKGEVGFVTLEYSLSV